MAMKTILFLLLCGFLYCPFWKTEPGQPIPAALAAPAPSSADTIRFAKDIQPILQNKCNPCHFPGGKMYEAMPFDQAKTILDHPEGILKRFKTGEEGRLMRAFLGQPEQ